ncbi:capsular polysaccharide biosynthesis protein [Achromobacter sp. MYb9]|uniref:capsular polysaccharide biosynthesis protein n=1 Tax=Achromobacter sp. MYb9 TaxID=1827284 RepID=UPI0013049870|nr:capsular polysaccharide biosynthesis protein [Achromobacter sp. MYb9]
MARKLAAVHWLDWGLWSQHRLASRLGARLTITGGFLPYPTDAAYIGWGLKKSGLRAHALSRRRKGHCWLLEDGFLRSLEGSDSLSHSLIIDDLGIYYDASRPSRLEALAATPLDGEQQDRTLRLIKAWRDHRLSKYNGGPDPQPIALPHAYVLVVDQTAGDAAIAAGGASAASFQKMLSDALSANPDCYVVVRVHPEVVSGRKQGHYDPALLRANPRILVVADGSHPALWIEHARAVYTVTSQLGFEALLWSKPVHVYGMPFYAGWGLTHDSLSAPVRRKRIPLEQLAYACLVGYARYFDPETGCPCEIETLMEWISLQRKQRQRFPAHLLAFGFSRWKQPFVRDFLAGSKPVFTRTLPSARAPDQPIVTWGHKHSAELEKAGYSDHVLRIEDGFLRSVGLGADLIRPLSWVIDPEGIYYDARSRSRLERILAEEPFASAIRERARALRRTIVEAGVTKYNLQHPEQWQRPPGGKRIVLVIGQVESDAAIRYGAGPIRRNLDLLKSARQARQDAWLLYKPHPDVRAGLRQQGDGESDALTWCDEVIGDVPFESLLPHVDEVHVLTSLAGFEALLRHVPVVTWGQPFYAGWGLTEDRGMTAEVLARRQRRVSLDELVAATLILYPTYVSRVTRSFCSPERAVQELLDWRSERKPAPLRRVVARLTRKP